MPYRFGCVPVISVESGKACVDEESGLPSTTAASREAEWSQQSGPGVWCVGRGEACMFGPLVRRAGEGLPVAVVLLVCDILCQRKEVP
jgi:hypothetical protein